MRPAGRGVAQGYAFFKTQHELFWTFMDSDHCSNPLTPAPPMTRRRALMQEMKAA